MRRDVTSAMASGSGMRKRRGRWLVLLPGRRELRKHLTVIVRRHGAVLAIVRHGSEVLSVLVHAGSSTAVAASAAPEPYT